MKGPHGVVLRLAGSTKHIQLKSSEEVVYTLSFCVAMSRLKFGNFKNILRITREFEKKTVLC